MTLKTIHTRFPAAGELLEQSLATLIQEMDWQSASEHSFRDANVALEAMPLASDEFGQAKANIRNAQEYARSGEFRAAQYELRLLRRRFPRSLP